MPVMITYDDRAPKAQQLCPDTHFTSSATAWRRAGLLQANAPFFTIGITFSIALAALTILGVGAPAFAQQPAPPPASTAPAEKPAPVPITGVLVVDDGMSGIEPFAAAQQAVRVFNGSGRGKAQLLATAAAKADEAIRGLATDAPAIIVIGSTAGATVERAAKDFPNNRFTLIGASANGPNVRSILFRDKEIDWLGAWLAGRTAGEGSVGFIGPAADATRHNALCAVAQGLATANPATMLFPDLPGVGVDIKLEAQRGAQLARDQIDRGAKVLMMPSGPTGAGAMAAVRDMGALGITQSSGAVGLFPYNVLAIQSRRYEPVIMGALGTAKADWASGTTSVGLAEQAVALQLNDTVRPPVPQTLRDALQQLVTAIASGAQTVPGVAADGTCPTQKR